MKFLIIFFLLPLQIFSQDITGIWKGSIQANGNSLPYELVISEDLTGYAYTLFIVDGIENIGIKSIKVKLKKGKLSIADDQLIYNNFSKPSRRIKIFSTMQVKTEDSLMTMTGTFQTKLMDFRAQDNTAYSGTISLQKQNGQLPTRLISKLAELNLLNTLSFTKPAIKENEDANAVASPAKKTRSGKIQVSSTDADLKKTNSIRAPAVSANQQKVELAAPANAAAEIATRKTEIIRSISFTSDSLILTLYDNGTVDGDTVSVVLNGKVIIPRQGLSEKAFRLIVHVTADLGDSLQLIMYAENLGSIPPNTGLLIVEDGNNRNEIRFEGDLQKSSSVILRRKRSAN